MYVDLRNRFELEDYTKDYLKSLIPPFGYNGFGEFIFYRTYSRIKEDEGQEDWADCVIRVIEGVFTIRKDWYLKNHIHWDEDFWQQYATDFGISMFKMEWLPPGRGLWAMGTNFIYERGSMALYNCAFTILDTVSLDRDISWLMDSLMMGVGVGFEAIRDEKMELYNPKGSFDYLIPDTREGWAESTRLKVLAYSKPGMKMPKMIYDKIRGPGLPIKGFGGVSSGPAPLKELHEFIDQEAWKFKSKREYDSVYFKTNVANHTGCCVIAGNVRRSAELAKGKMNDPIFKDLKDYTKFPEREKFGYMCLDQSTWISTSEGPRQISQLIGKPYFAIVDGQKYQSEGFFEAGEKDLIEIDAQGFLLKCSSDHKIMTSIGWKKAVDLNLGDQLRINDFGIKVWEGDGSWEEGYLLGVAVGDGSFDKDGRCHIVSSLRDEGSHTLRDKIIDILRKLPRKQQNTELKWTMSPSCEEGESLTLSCSTITYIAKKYDIGYQNKTITTKVELASSNFNKGFLRGLFDTDGSVEKLGKNGTARGVRLAQSDINIMRAVQRMLARFNIQSRILEVSGSEWSKKPSYCLTIRSESVLFYKYEIGFTHERKNNLLNDKFKTYVSSKRLYATVTSIKNYTKIKMYDCTVANIHAYDANGIFVSNSNNSVALETDEDFQSLGEIAKRVIMRGEPGYINMLNFPYARIGKKMKGLRKDKAIGINPCAEIPLENKETCNVAETCPTVSNDPNLWLKSCEYSTLYASTVSLLPTHQKDTNKVVAKNRRIGVSIIDWTGWKLEHGMHKVIGWMREGYKMVRSINKWANEEAGIPVSIRVTTIKPGGTGPKLPGRTPGIGHPTFDYTIRRVRVGKSSPVHELLVQANVPYEEDYFDKYTDVFEWPIIQGPAPPAEKVTLWEQAFNLVTVQREWSDNAVSNTLYFKPMWSLVKVITDDFIEILESYIGTITANLLIMDEVCEYVVPDRYKIQITRDEYQAPVEIKVYEYNPNHEENHIEPVLSCIAPLTKSVSLLPHSANGVYRQMPEEGITKEEYMKRYSQIHRIDWSKLSGSDGQDEQFCSAEGCIIREYK